MPAELPKTYEPRAHQARVAKRWMDARAFSARPDARGPDERYVVMMPLPNVTGALHLGHAMNNVMQDLLVRWQRMRGKNTLWQPGTDHAGIATQAVVEKRLLELEGKTRLDVGREGLVDRIWAWKREYGERIVDQQIQMGCSADWDRQRFTMDEVCTRAVRECFFRLFRDGLVQRGNRLVNWDCQLQTAVSDDEVYHELVKGHFWHVRYDVIDPAPGELDAIVVATTRPETMLGDTAVAVHPEPRTALETRREELVVKLAAARARERDAVETELRELESRFETHLPTLEKLAAMAALGRCVRLPLLEREIPLIADTWARPDLGSGSVKITPAHDQNDYEVWGRQAGAIEIRNILEPDGTLNELAGRYAGLDRLEARSAVVADLEREGRLEHVEDRDIELGHSDRSKSPIEPFLSEQWFVRMGDVPGGIVCGRDVEKRFESAGLAQAAMDVASGVRTPGGHTLRFHPDERYRNTYLAWLAEKRDWCISRQLWWGHRIPVWSTRLADGEALDRVRQRLPSGDDVAHRVVDVAGGFELQVCLRDGDSDAVHAASLAELGLEQDPDVLDTWFSSALWPMSTLGWPEPATAPITAGQTTLASSADGGSSLDYYYPGSCLVTSRDIITLWVARMVVMGLYNLGDVPFTDVFVHAKILDGKGETMSKSRGNGIDPVDVVDRYGVDALRYLICDLQTGLQDTRIPVQAECPLCSVKVELARARHGRTIFTYLCTDCGGEFDVLGSMPDVPSATILSDRFEIGRSFCNKLWNAARFALQNLGRHEMRPLAPEELRAEDRWILSRLSRAVRAVSDELEAYHPSAALSCARDFFWNELCDWYLELVKPRMRDPAEAPVARQVLAVALDQVLRLLHPFVPFITEAIWEQLGEQAPVRGIEAPLPRADLCVLARWPEPAPALEDPALELEFARLMEVIGALREIRAQHDVPPSRELPAALRAPDATLASLRGHGDHIRNLARLSGLEMGSSAEPPPDAATRVMGEIEVQLGGVVDREKERERATRRRQKLEKQVRQSEAKLANPKFVERAKPEVVATERTRLDEARAELLRLESQLQEQR